MPPNTAAYNHAYWTAHGGRKTKRTQLKEALAEIERLNVMVRLQAVACGKHDIVLLEQVREISRLRAILAARLARADSPTPR